MTPGLPDDLRNEMEMDDDQDVIVARYFKWLDQGVDVIKGCVGMEGMSTILVNALQNLIDTVRKSQQITEAAIVNSKMGVPAEVTVAAAAAVLTNSTNGTGTGEGIKVDGGEEYDREMGLLTERFRSSMYMEKVRTVKEHTEELLGVLKKSAVASVKSVSAVGSPAVGGVLFKKEVSPIGNNGMGVGTNNSGVGLGMGENMVMEGSNNSMLPNSQLTAFPGLISSDPAVMLPIGTTPTHDSTGRLANVATSVEEFLDLLNMDWAQAGVGAGTDAVFDGMMGFDGGNNDGEANMNNIGSGGMNMMSGFRLS
ncbi:hypothetical protein HDU76_011044 [Blyttiomyces sp. JEL0837]|nr:hypothetical protein HDU76_011044 [Blyttiomyces sp. JEL0837]